MATVTDIPPGSLSALTPAITPAIPPAATPATGAAATRGRGGGHSLFGADGLTFRDLLDIINPLQHLPIVSHIYRALTHDELSPGSRMAGGAVFGGFIGLGVAILNTVIEDLTGKDIGGHVIALFTGADEPGGQGETSPKVMLADATPPPVSAPSLLPPQIVAVYREPLAPPVGMLAAPPRDRTATVANTPGSAHPTRVALAVPERMSDRTSDLVPDPMKTRPRPTARRSTAPVLRLNTDLIDMLMFSVPFEFKDGPAVNRRGDQDARGQGRTGPFGDTRSRPSAAARTAGHQAYLRGHAARVAANTL